MKTLHILPILAIVFAFLLPAQADARTKKYHRHSDGKRVTYVQKTYVRSAPVRYYRPYRSYRTYAPAYYNPYYNSRPYYHRYPTGGVNVTVGF